jgi:plastocyanin
MFARLRWAAALLALCSGLPARLDAGTLTVSVRNGKGEPVADAVVLAHGAGGTGKAGPAAKTAIVDQIDKEFVPWVSVIPVGTAVTFPNKDNLRHHVYSFSPAKKFELPLYAGTPAKPVVFDQPGLVTLGCNIHDWMVAYVYVTDAPAFARSDANGNASLELAAGTWQLTAWHPAIKGGKDSAPQSVSAAPGAATVVITVDLDPSKKRRRAPAPGDKSY